MTAPGDLSGILHRLQRIWEKRPHLLLGFKVKLTTLVSHTILVLYLMLCLDTKQNIMRLRILGTDIMHIVSRNKLQPRLLTHAQKPLINDLLRINTMILKLKIEMIRSEDLRQTQCFLLGFLIKALTQIRRNNARQTGTERNDALMIFLEHLRIHSRLIIKPLRKPDRDNLHQIGIPKIILCQKHQMVISILPPDILPIKARPRCHINLTADHRIDSFLFRRPVEINHPIHIAMVGNGDILHAKFLRPAHQLADLTGAI